MIQSGLLEREHAHRVIQNYNLIYNLGLPLRQISEYLNEHTQTGRGQDVKRYVVMDSLLMYLSSM